MSRVAGKISSRWRLVHREFDFACPAAVHRDGGVGSLIGDRLRVVAVLGLVKRDDGEA
jgi:hypothetical protein